MPTGVGVYRSLAAAMKYLAEIGISWLHGS